MVGADVIDITHVKRAPQRTFTRCLLYLLVVVGAALVFTKGFDWQTPSLNFPSLWYSIRRRSNQRTFLTALTENEFAWSASTTPIPVSSASVWLKLLLSGSNGIPPSLRELVSPADTVPIAPVRRWLNAQRFDRVIGQLCGKDSEPPRCNVNERDSQYGLSPMHVAVISGDEPLQTWLRTHGADVNVMDTAGRKPANLSFTHFMSNSKRWAREAGRHHCDIPEVVFEAGASKDQVRHAMKESRRLVFEGEPFLMRGALRYFAPGFVDGWSTDKFITLHGNIDVQVGSVPYAPYFNVSSSVMRLQDFYDQYVKTSHEKPMYVFQQNFAANREGYGILVKIIRDLFPVPSLLLDPDDAGGVDGIHFYLGQPGSGAPMHIHADAVNALVQGSKRWYIYTPSRSIYSRKPIKQWLEEEYVSLSDDEKPMECLQRSGDLVYVPLDWGHAVINEEQDTFGYALELMNKRDTFAHLLPELKSTRDEL